jgi:PilZ domain
MAQKLMDVLKLGRCSHEFSWPRRAEDGDYYQVCLLCAAEYRYDWKTMRRTERLQRSALDSAKTRRRAHSERPTWVPRARRLKLVAPIRYRVKNLAGWHAGTTENLSQSGVLFHGAKPLPQNTLVEMRFEMPEEISGQKNSNVLCQGRVVRLKDKSNHDQEGALLAAYILDYKFIH